MNLLKTFVIFLLCVLVFPVLAGDCELSTSGSGNLDYKSRGNRCEGIHPKLVGAYDIELISAVTTYHESFEKFPKKFKLQFCLPKRQRNVHAKVHELEAKHFYIMTDLDISWTQNCGSFVWSTETVIQSLSGLGIYDLGVLMRLKGTVPSIKEKIVPAVLYHQKLPSSINGYLFTFKTNRDAELEYYIRRGRTEIFKSSTPLLTRKNQPFQVRWDTQQRENGNYQLVLKGFFVSNGETIYQSVRFYHNSRTR